MGYMVRKPDYLTAFHFYAGRIFIATEISYSRMADQLDAYNHGKETPNMNKGEETAPHLLVSENIKTLAVGNKVDMGLISSPVPWVTLCKSALQFDLYI